MTAISCENNIESTTLSSFKWATFCKASGKLPFICFFLLALIYLFIYLLYDNEENETGLAYKRKDLLSAYSQLYTLWLGFE